MADFCVFSGQILDPAAFFQDPAAEQALDHVGNLADHVQGDNGQARVPAQEIGERGAAGPQEAAVKQEGDEGLAAGAEGEVSGVGIGVEKAHDGGNDDHFFRQQPDGIGGVIDLWEEGREEDHQQPEEGACHNGGEDQLPAGVPDFLPGCLRAQQLPHENAHRVAHGLIDHAAEINKGGGNVQSGNHIQTARGVALVQERNTAGPETFVDQQRKPLYGDPFQQGRRDISRAVCAPDEGLPSGMGVGPDGDDGKLGKPGNDGGVGRAPDTHGGGTEMSENQHIVEPQIDNHRSHACQHGHHGFLGFPEGAGIGVGNGKGQQPQQHDVQVFPAVAQRLGHILRAAFAGQIQPDEGIPGGEKQKACQNRKKGADHELEPEGVPDALVILRAVKLGSKNTGTGTGAENAQIENKGELIDDGNAAHGQRADPAHHDVIQQGDKVGDAVLNNNGQDNRDYPPVKCPVPNVLAEHDYLSFV